MTKQMLRESETQELADKLVFRYVPAYAAFIKANYLVPYIREQIDIAREIKLPMLKFFEGIPDEELIAMSIESHREFLTAVENNMTQRQVEKSLKTWVADELGIIRRDEVTAEDITLGGYIRKKALIKFLPSYTTDVPKAIEIVNEIDAFTVEGDAVAINVYINLLKNRITEKMERLLEVERRYKQAEELSAAGTWAWHITTGKIEWTDALYKIYDIKPGTELTFDDIMSFNDPDDNERIKDGLKECLNNFRPSETYYHITLKNGTKKILHARSEAFADHSGKASIMIGVIQDVTERQRLIEKLQRSEELYKQAQSLGHIGNWTWDMSTKDLTWSDEIYNIYELEPQSINSSFTLDQYNHPEDEPLIRHELKMAVETNRPFDFNYRIVLKSGKMKIVRAKGEIEQDREKPVKIFGTLQDITEQKITEKQLKDYRDFIKKITDVTPSIIASYNVHTGRYSYINDAVEKLLGHPTKKIMDEGVAFLSSIVHPDDLPVIMEKNAAVMAEANGIKAGDNEPIAEFKYRMQNAHGEYRWFHTYGTVFERNEKGMVESVLNISVDITDQVAAEQALFQKNLQLQQSNTSLEEYAYVASHDLKEPLRKISTFSDRLLTTQANLLTEDGKIYLHKIIDSSKRMQSMIGDLLSVSTILSNIDREQCDLKHILGEALIPLEHKIEENRAVIEADDLPVVSVVPSQFRQLFQNLISNSLKFARSGVTPHIRISHKIVDDKSVARYGLAKAKKYLQLQLQDNGIGFGNEYAIKIFAIFQRLHGKADYDGTGIGLSICKKIVENHGGIIFAEGIINEGAIFTIIFPL